MSRRELWLPLSGALASLRVPGSLPSLLYPLRGTWYLFQPFRLPCEVGMVGKSEKIYWVVYVKKWHFRDMLETEP